MDPRGGPRGTHGAPRVEKWHFLAKEGGSWSARRKMAFFDLNRRLSWSDFCHFWKKGPNFRGGVKKSENFFVEIFDVLTVAFGVPPKISG